MPGYKRRYNYGGMRGYGRRIPQLTQQMLEAMRCVEKKYKDFAIASGANSVPTTGTSISILGTANLGQGMELAQRHGKKVYLKSVQLFFRLSAAMTSLALWTEAAIPWRYRIMIVRKYANNESATPTPWTSILSDIGAATSFTMAPLNVDQMRNFKILYDKKITKMPYWHDMDETDTKYVAFPTLEFRKTLTFKKPLLITYNNENQNEDAAEPDYDANAGIQSKLIGNDLHLLLWTNAPSTGAGTYAVTSIDCRMRWTD